MGCDIYSLENVNVQFDENDDTACLCTFFLSHGKFHHRIDPETLRSLALLGAAVLVARQDEYQTPGEHWLHLPQDIPQWIQDETKRLIPDE